MKYHNSLIALATVLLMGFGSATMAAPDEEATEQAAEAELQAQLEAEYRNALAEAEHDRHEAEATMEKAREQLHRVSERQAESSEEQARARAAQEAQMAEMHEELNRARKQLQLTSREIARVNREVARVRADEREYSFVYRTSERPVIGIVLGDNNGEGFKVIGVSPDGPSERAGIEKGDVIVSLDGHGLGTDAEEGDSGLRAALKGIETDEPIIVSVMRDGETLDLTVIPEVREPLGWHTVTRFPSAPEAPESPGGVVSIERIVVPELDTEALAERIEQIRINIDERLPMITAGSVDTLDGYAYELHELSELGNTALLETNVWFGMPMTQGLKLAEIDPGLGEYFKTDRGVLVLKARDDNGLQLESGDVILQVGDTEVNSPADFMRALREIESGEELSIDIKRNRKNKTLKTTMPESRISFFAPEISSTHSVRISHHTD